MIIIRTLVLGIITLSVAVVGKQVFPVNTDPSAVLYKGTIGTLPCRYERKISSVVWYKDQSLAVLISLDIDQNGYQTRSGTAFIRGEVDITDDFSLIIKRVKVAHEGRYYCVVFDLENELSFKNYTDLSVMAFSSGPVIEPCVLREEGKPLADPPACTYDASNHTSKFNLTCTLSGFRPDVLFSWRSSVEYLKQLHSTKATLADGTLERTVTVEVDPKNKERTNFTCSATGKAVNGTVSTSVTILYKKITDVQKGSFKWNSTATWATLAVIIIVVIGFLKKNRSKKPLLDPLLGQDYERHHLIKKAMEARQDGRYDDVVKHLVEVIKEKDQRLSVAERRLLKDAYFKLVIEQRTFLQNLNFGKDDSKSRTTVRHRGNREEIKLRLLVICKEVLELLDTSLIKPLSQGAQVNDIEEKIFYLTMKGDYIRCMIRCQSDEEIERSKTVAQSAYEEANNLSIKYLPPAHATRLRISIKLSVFYVEILQQRSMACKLASEAIEAASKDFDDEGNDERTDRIHYMSTLHKFLEYWNADDWKERSPISEFEMDDAC